MIEKAALILRFLFFLACLQNYDCTDSAATTLPPVVTTTVGIPAQTTGGAPAAVNPANVASTPKNPAPKPNLSGATTKKCGSEDCSGKMILIDFGLNLFVRLLWVGPYGGMQTLEFTGMAPLPSIRIVQEDRIWAATILNVMISNLRPIHVLFLQSTRACLISC